MAEKKKKKCKKKQTTKKKWEIAVKCDSDNTSDRLQHRELLRRIEAPGGWLYLHQRCESLSTASESMVFVPKPEV